jgi:hypothetical protein
MLATITECRLAPRHHVLVPKVFQLHMPDQAVRWSAAGTAALAAAMLLTSCAVGPDFVHPAAPEVTRYTREPLAAQTSSTDVADGQRQRFVESRDIPKDCSSRPRSTP